MSTIQSFFRTPGSNELTESEVRELLHHTTKRFRFNDGVVMAKSGTFNKPATTGTHQFLPQTYYEFEILKVLLEYLVAKTKFENENNSTSYFTQNRDIISSSDADSACDLQTGKTEDVFTPVQNGVLEHLMNVKAMTGGGCSIQDISVRFSFSEIQ